MSKDMKLIMEGWRKFSKLLEAEESDFMKRRRAQLAAEKPEDKGDTKVLKFGKKSEREPEGYQDPLADYFPPGSPYSLQGYVDPDPDPDRDPLEGESDEDWVKHLVTTGERMINPFAYVGPEDGGPTDEEAEESEKEAAKAVKDRYKGLKTKKKKSTKGKKVVNIKVAAANAAQAAVKYKPFRHPEDIYGNAIPALETDDNEMISMMAQNPIAKEGNTLYLRGLVGFGANNKGEGGDAENIKRWENELKTMIAGNANLYKPENRESLINIIKYGLTQDPRGFILNRVRREVQERGIDDPQIIKMIPAKPSRGF